MVTGHPVLETARRALHDYRARQEGRDPNMVNFPAAALDELHRATAMGAASSVFQLVPFSPQGWSVDEFRHELWRQVASRGVRVERTYVLPHRGIARTVVRRQVDLDLAAGIRARVVVLSRIPETERAVIPQGLWLIDDAAAVVARGSASDHAVWTLTLRESDLVHARGLWDQIQVWSEDPHAPEGEAVELEEPLVLSADLMHGVAGVLCTHDHVDRDSCAWYHGAWQYLRLLNMVSTPTWHSEFYLRALENVFSERPDAKALVTGTADYSMLAYLDAAARTSSADPDITVLDLCATPLFACRWYAKRANRVLTTIAEDVLMKDEASLGTGTYDVICTDAFLTRFSASESRLIVRRWAELLRVGGRLITTVRIHKRSPAARDREQAVRDFRVRAELQAQRWAPFIDRNPAEIGELAEDYARRMQSADVGTETDVVGELRRAGITVVEQELREVPGELHPTTYLELVCELEADTPGTEHQTETERRSGTDRRRTAMKAARLGGADGA